MTRDSELFGLTGTVAIYIATRGYGEIRIVSGYMRTERSETSQVTRATEYMLLLFRFSLTRTGSYRFEGQHCHPGADTRVARVAARSPNASTSVACSYSTNTV
jgi:hypothetical protein